MTSFFIQISTEESENKFHLLRTALNLICLPTKFKKP